MERVAFATRSVNEELYALSGELLGLPYPRFQLKDTTADGYFYLLHELDADWVINIDEDAFVAAPERMLELVQFMKDNDYDCCGMPDGGVVDIRFHNPLVPNAFFTIFNTKKIREWFDLSEIEKSRFDEKLKVHSPTHLFRSNALEYDEFEPYYNYFFWLLNKGAKFLYLDAIQWTRDSTSTLLCDHLRRPFLIHSWYARDYERQKQRFHQAVKYCKVVQQQLGAAAA